MVLEGSDGELGARRVAAWVADAGRGADFRALGEFGQAICPVVVEAVVGGEVDDDALAVAGLGYCIESIDVGLADAVGERHDPAVYFAVFVELRDVLGRQCLVDDLALGVALQFLTSKLSRRHMAQIHQRVVVEQVNQGLAGIASSSYEADARLCFVGGILLAEGRIGVGGRGIAVSLLLHTANSDGALGEAAASTRGRRLLAAVNRRVVSRRDRKPSGIVKSAEEASVGARSCDVGGLATKRPRGDGEHDGDPNNSLATKSNAG